MLHRLELRVSLFQEKNLVLLLTKIIVLLFEIIDTFFSLATLVLSPCVFVAFQYNYG